MEQCIEVRIEVEHHLLPSVATTKTISRANGSILPYMLCVVGSISIPMKFNEKSLVCFFGSLIYALGSELMLCNDDGSGKGALTGRIERDRGVVKQRLVVAILGPLL